VLKLRERYEGVEILCVRTAARHWRTASSNVLSVAMCCIEVLDVVWCGCCKFQKFEGRSEKEMIGES